MPFYQRWPVTHPGDAMFGVKANYLYCMGESVLNKRQYAQDTATAQSANRMGLDQIFARQTTQAAQSLQPAPNPFAQPPQNPVMTFVNTVVTALIRPFVAMGAGVQVLQSMLANAGRQVAQGMQNAMTSLGQTLASAGQVAARIGAFFFGNRKSADGAIVDEADRENRERNLFAMPEDMGADKVEGAEGSSMGGGQS